MIRLPPEAVVLPGFVDCHTHMGWAAEARWNVDWSEITDRAGAIAAARAVRARVPGSFWMLGGGWSRERLTDRELPTLAELDSLGDGPLWLTSEDRSLALANTRALALIGPGAELAERDDGGASTGRFVGPNARAQPTVLVIPPRDRHRARAELRSAFGFLASLGVTEVHDMATPPGDLPTPLVDIERSFTDASLFEDLLASGDLPLRVSARAPLERVADAAALRDRWAAHDDRLRCDGLKLLLDAQRYSDRPGPYTYRYPGFDAALALMRDAERRSLDVSIHALGDEAVREALDLIERFATARSRPRLVHARRMAAADIARAARLGAVVEVQPWDLAPVLPELERRFPDDHGSLFPFRALLDAGAVLACSSDWRRQQRPDGLDADPLEAIRLAVTRHGAPLGVAEAIAGYTTGAAYAGRQERRRGTLAAGNDADLVVLSHDVVAEPDRLGEARVLLTVVGGEIVFDREVVVA